MYERLKAMRENNPEAFMAYCIDLLGFGAWCKWRGNPEEDNEDMDSILNCIDRITTMQLGGGQIK